MTPADSDLRGVIERFTIDRAGLSRRYHVDWSQTRRSRFREYYENWRKELASIEFNGLSHEGKVDYVLFRNELASELSHLGREERLAREAAVLTPFAPVIIELQESRRRMETLDPRKAAVALNALVKQIEATRKGVEAGLPAEGKGGKGEGEGEKDETGKAEGGKEQERTAEVSDKNEGAKKEPAEKVAPIETTRIVAFRAADITSDVTRTLEQWFKYYAGYDPMFSWWAEQPYKKVDEELKAYRKVLREKVVGAKEGEDEPIVGDPIGRADILEDLKHEFIAYTPEELVAIAEQEFAWCEAEMKKAARDMGFGDDWKAALEKVKQDHVEPGQQTELIRDLAIEATEFVESRNLVTVPPLAKEMWRIEMMSPEAQKTNPFFLGGEIIQVSFPTDTMEHEDKLMSMRGNNRHFARATVHHELIPGHHLQGFMTDRHSQWRRAFSTSFWGEGWALYWEMQLWDLDFPQTPENKVGMLFWRMHRAARIIFSLGFHLGTMTPQECIDFLVDRVGHERANATAEVRRSFNGNYGPLYQVAYMIGGLQFRALHEELVKPGTMTSRAFHDAILQNGRIPVELVRVILTKQPISADYAARWRFAGSLPEGKKTSQGLAGIEN